MTWDSMELVGVGERIFRRILSDEGKMALLNNLFGTPLPKKYQIRNVMFVLERGGLPYPREATAEVDGSTAKWTLRVHPGPEKLVGMTVAAVIVAYEDGTEERTPIDPILLTHCTVEQVLEVKLEF